MLGLFKINSIFMINFFIWSNSLKNEEKVKTFKTLSHSWYLFTNFTIDTLNSIADLLIPSYLTISIKFSITLNFSNIWPCWYATHVSFVTFNNFFHVINCFYCFIWAFNIFCFFNIFISYYLYHHWIFHVLQNLLFYFVFFILLVSKLLS